MSNNLDPDQDRHFVGPDLDPNCLQRLSADDTSRQRFKSLSTGAKLIRHQSPNKIVPDQTAPIGATGA